MAVRLSRSTPDVTTAGSDLVSAVSDMVAATGRWLALQPSAQEIPVHAERARQASTEALGHAGDWAGATAGRARDATADAASTAKTGLVNILLVVVLLWWVDRMLSRGSDA